MQLHHRQHLTLCEYTSNWVIGILCLCSSLGDIEDHWLALPPLAFLSFMGTHIQKCEGSGCQFLTKACLKGIFPSMLLVDNQLRKYIDIVMDSPQRCLGIP
jgi:hypothetical protein